MLVLSMHHQQQGESSIASFIRCGIHSRLKRLSMLYPARLLACLVCAGSNRDGFPS